MESIKIKQRVGHDGMLHLDIPVGLTNREMEVMVVYQPVPLASMETNDLGQFYGVCADDPIVLDDQGILEALDNEMAGAFD